MAEKNKKKKPSLEERHRQLQDSVEALPLYIEQLKAQPGFRPRVQAFMLRYVSGPITRFMKRTMDKQRYGGTEGAKLKQKEQMKRHLEQRQKAMEYFQGELARQQKRAQKRQGGGGGGGKRR